MSEHPHHPRRDASPLVALQVLRALAAMMVVMHHAGYDADTLANRTGRPLLALDRGFDWTFGIHLFFVVSGFIMVRTAHGFGSPSAAAIFAIRRVVRVVPLYWLLTSLVVVGGLLAPELLNVPLGGTGVILGSYAFVPIFRSDGGINPVLGQGWTLDYEMFFYALFALAMLMPRRVGLAALAGTLLALAATGSVVRPGGALAAVWTGELLLEFLFGLAVGLLAERGVRTSATSAVLLIALGIAAAVALGPLSPAFDRVSPVARAGLPATLIVAGGVLGPRWPRRWGMLGLSALGDASYSLYLSHPFVIRLLRVAWSVVVPPTVPLALYAVGACVAAIVVAMALYRWVERPMTLALQRWTNVGGRRPILPDVAVRDG